MGGGELGPQLGGVGGDLAGALGELGQESLGHAGHLEPGLVEWRRSRSSQPTSRAPVNRSASAPSYSSDSVVTALYRARESSVRQRPSELHLARAQTSRWSCSWGSSERLAQWLKLTATTPCTSSSTTPLVPDRERITSASA